MVLYKSPHPDLQYPTNVTTWEWLFEDPAYSPLRSGSKDVRQGAYINAITGERLGYPSVKTLATSLSIAIVQKYHFQPGQTVSLFSTNTIWYPVAMWAVIRAGGRVNGASPAYTVEEMTHALKTADSKILMTLPQALPMALAAADNVGIPHSHVVVLEGSASGFTSVQDLIKIGDSLPRTPPWRIPPGLDNRRICGYLNFSSGTTGLPKAVMLSHHNVIAQCLQLQQLQIVPASGYKVLAVMPLYHITGLIRFCTYPLLYNGDSIMLPSFTMAGMCKAVVDFQIEELILVPPIIVRLVQDPIVKQFDLRGVKRWSSGSAPIPPEIIKKLQEMFPQTGFRQGYGATESAACITCHPPSHYDYKYATTGGLLVANTVAKVIDIETGGELGAGETGEICARGPQIAMGYLNNEDATREAFDQEGFLHTGDVGHFDEEGLVHIEDRIKEMIKVKGTQVAPAELEDLLLGHADVEDCAVVGIRDEYAGERPKAFVVLKTQGGVGSKDALAQKGRMLLNWVKEKKVRYKWLQEIEFVDEIPKSPTGKLLRRVLKTREQKGQGVGLKVRVENAKL